MLTGEFKKPNMSQSHVRVYSLFKMPENVCSPNVM